MRAAALCLLLTMFPFAGGATPVPPLIDQDTTWTQSASPYVLTDEDATVDEGVTLTLEPGVVVHMGAKRSLRIGGALIARGTADRPIHFMGQPADEESKRWASVHFLPSSVPAAYEGLDTYASGSILEHVTFENGDRAVRLEEASPLIARCTFRDNQHAVSGDTQGGAALFVGEGSHPRVVGSLFKNNFATGVAQGGAIFVDRGQPIIQDNLFKGNRSVYGGAITTDGVAAPIVGNTFEENAAVTEGGAISLVSSIPAFLNNLVTRNTAFLDGGGVHVCVTCFPHAAPFAMDNRIIENTNRIEGAAGFGAAYLRLFTNNDIYDNTRNGEPADFGWFNDNAGDYPSWVTDVAIPDNWWGTTDLDAIATTLFDHHDEEALGTANYEPVREGPIEGPLPRVTITTRKLRYGTPSEPMPVFVTLYNPGPSRTVEVVILLQYGDDPPFPYQGPLSFPDAIPKLGAYTLTLPENSAWFATLITPICPEGQAEIEGTWHAALHDAETGDPIGELVSSRFTFGPEVAH